MLVIFYKKVVYSDKCSVTRVKLVAKRGFLWQNNENSIYACQFTLHAHCFLYLSFILNHHQFILYVYFFLPNLTIPPSLLISAIVTLVSKTNTSSNKCLFRALLHIPVASVAVNPTPLPPTTSSATHIIIFNIFWMNIHGV